MPATSGSTLAPTSSFNPGQALSVPPAARKLAGFRDWACSDEFPEGGRIDFLDGMMEVDMSPEDLYTHGAVKTALAARLYQEVVEAELGHLFVDRTRVTCPAAGLSAEPDLVVVLWPALEDGRVKQIPAASKGAGRFVELEGAPDLIVEILSDSSYQKDTQRLPQLYARAGVPELWLVDARGNELSFQLHALHGDSYQPVLPDADGWLTSGVLGRSCRLRRQPSRFSSWRYFLDLQPIR